MFGFFKKQAKNANKEHDASSHGPVVDTQDTMTVSNNEDFSSPDPVTSLRRRLEAKVDDLSAQIAAKDAEIFKLKNSLGDLTREVGTKAAGMERVQAELESAFKETELARRALKKFEEEKETFRQKNDELKEELEKLNSSSDSDDSDEDDEDEEESEEEDYDDEDVKLKRLSKDDLRKRVKHLERQLKEVTAERDQLLLEKDSAQKEFEEEMRQVKEALEEAVAQKKAVTAKYEKEYEQLRTVNSDREQQMLDDFEWKLREVEKNAKKRIEDKTKEAERRVREVQVKLDQRTALHTNDVEKLKKIEEEMTQLRSVSHDQQRLLREAQREHDKLEVNIGMLNTEISRLNAQLEKEKNVLSAVQGLNLRKREEREEIYEKQLEIQRKNIAAEVEERVKKELEQQMRDQLEEQLQKRKDEFERELAVEQKRAETKLEKSQRQVALLRDQIAKKEEKHRLDMSNAIQEADSSRMELRRKLDKLDLNYQDKIEALTDAHTLQMEELEKRASQAENQLISSKTTLELVKEQMTRDFDERFNDLFTQHQRQLERHRDELQEVHEEEIAAVQERHSVAMKAVSKNKHNGDLESVDLKDHQEALQNLRKQELMISDLVSTIREQDHALTTLTQEKRELQLRMSSSPENVTPAPRVHQGPTRVLRKISECTEPSRESSMESCGVHIEEVFDDEDDFQVQDHEFHLSVVQEEDSMKLSPSPSGCSSDPKTFSTSEEDELHVPRAYFLCHSPDQVFPAKRRRPERCRSLDLLGSSQTLPFFGRSVSCPARWLSSDDDWGD